MVRKTGGNFKEKLHELGGLDAVFEVIMNCHSVMKVRACMIVFLCVLLNTIASHKNQDTLCCFKTEEQL
jgi:hypothetical protein